MGCYSVTESIAAPADAIWAVLADPTRAPEWMKTVGKVEQTSEGPVCAGTTFRAAANQRGRHGRTVTIAEWEDGRRIALASKSGDVEAVYDYTCEPAEDGKTRVTLKATCEGSGFLWAVVQPVLIFMIKSTDGGQIKRLKRLVEAAPAPAEAVKPRSGV